MLSWSTRRLNRIANVWNATVVAIAAIILIASPQIRSKTITEVERTYLELKATIEQTVETAVDTTSDGLQRIEDEWKEFLYEIDEEIKNLRKDAKTIDPTRLKQDTNLVISLSEAAAKAPILDPKSEKELARIRAILAKRAQQMQEALAK